ISPEVKAEDGTGAPSIDVTATRDPETGALTVFAVNRNEQDSGRLDLKLVTSEDLRVVEHLVMGGVELMATNSQSAPNRVTPRESTQHELAEGKLSVVLPPVSWSVLRLDAV